MSGIYKAFPMHTTSLGKACFKVLLYNQGMELQAQVCTHHMLDSKSIQPLILLKAGARYCFKSEYTSRGHLQQLGLGEENSRPDRVLLGTTSQFPAAQMLSDKV